MVPSNDDTKRNIDMNNTSAPLLYIYCILFIQLNAASAVIANTSCQYVDHLICSIHAIWHNFKKFQKLKQKYIRSNIYK